MNCYTIRWMDKDGLADSERVVAECFDDAVSRCKTKAALCEGAPKDVEDFGPITILETKENIGE